MNSISKIWKKFEYYNYIGIKVLGRCELIQRLLIEKLVKASVKGLWKNSVEEEEFIRKIHKKIVPFRMQLTA